jgi:hypothetical protein
VAEPGETKRKRGSVTALALLVGLLLGVPASGAQPQPGSGSAHFDNGKILRFASSLRAANRLDDHGPGDEASQVSLPPPTAAVTELGSVRPAAAISRAALPTTPFDPQFRYHARAPPAA